MVCPASSSGSTKPKVARVHRPQPRRLAPLLGAVLLCFCSADHGAPNFADVITHDAPIASPCPTPESCQQGLTCVEYGGSGLCSLDCDDDSPCPSSTECHESQCHWTYGTVGSACDGDDPCHPGLQCIQLGPHSACTRPCGFDLPCPAREDALCVRLADDQGQICMERCTSDQQCAPGLACTPLSSAPTITVCAIDF